MNPEEVLNKMVEGISQELAKTFDAHKGIQATYTYLDGDEVIVRVLDKEEICK